MPISTAINILLLCPSDTNYNFGSVEVKMPVTGSYTSRLANEKVKWGRPLRQYNVGIDARFLNGRSRTTCRRLYQEYQGLSWYKLPYWQRRGTSGPIINGGDVKNQRC